MGKVAQRGPSQWGQPFRGKNSFTVVRSDDELEITAAMPKFESEKHACDLVYQYENARKDRSIGKQHTGKDSPQIRFANANCDDDLVDFVSNFGPVVCKSLRIKPVTFSSSEKWPDDEFVELVLEARQDLRELRNEQKAYKAALSLIVELQKEDRDYDYDHAQKQIAVIARGIQEWPRQWRREKEAAGKDPLWTPGQESIRAVLSLAESHQDALLTPKLDARIVLCEILNRFHSRIFPNPVALHAYIQFGIRPLLYSLLRREFLQMHDVGVCANFRCGQFFEVERAGQRYCNETCSRQQRQREYWEMKGKALRKERLKPAKAKRQAKKVRGAFTKKTSIGRSA